MNEKRHIKRAFISSFTSLLLCCSLFIGSTFAWFSSSVCNVNNIVQSGVLDMKLFYKPYGSEYETWTEVDEKTEIFSDNTYEPGHVNAIWFKVENTGNLAFKYQLVLDVLNEVSGINVLEKMFHLSDYLLVKAGLLGTEYLKYEKQYVDRAELLLKISDTEIELGNGVRIFGDSLNSVEEVIVEPNEEAYVCVLLYLPEDVGNNANHNGINIPSISLGIRAFASQTAWESDSFGNDYDKGAEDEYEEDDGIENDGNVDDDDNQEDDDTGAVDVFEIATAAELFALAEDVNINGNSYSGKIVKLTSDIDLENQKWTPIGEITAFAGIFDGQRHTISNLFIDSDGSAGLFGELDGTVQNLTVEDATVRGKSNVGIIAGSAEMADINNVLVKSAYIVGHDNFGEIVGSGVTGTVKTEDVMTFDLDTCTVIMNAEELFAFADDVNVNKNNFSGKTVYLLRDINLENKDWTPIGQTGATQFAGTFDGLNHTIYNLTIDASNNTEATTNSYYCNAMFGWTEGNITIKNLIIDGAKVSGAYHYSAVLVGYLTGNISNCEVKNAVVDSTHSSTLNKGITGMNIPDKLIWIVEMFKLADSGYCGDKVGAIVGHINKGTVDQIILNNCNITGGRDVGQIAGAAKASQITNYVVDNKTVKADINRTCGWATNSLVSGTYKNCNGGIIGNVLD